MFQEQTAKDLNVPLALVKSIIDFQWEFTKSNAGEKGAKTVEITELFTLHWKEIPAKRYIRHLNYILESLYKNPNIPQRERKISEIIEKIETCNSKMPGNTQGYISPLEGERLQQEQEENMPELPSL